MSRISAIVPVFRVEKYIERCARSLFEQSLDDIQYIFINDGTDDRSIDILKETMDYYPDRLAQVVILNHPSTLGISKARQDGFGVATGKYVIHCDSDDWWEPDAFEQLFQHAEARKADVVVFDYFWNYENGEEHASNRSFSDNMLSSIMRGCVPGYLWNKMISHQLYSQLRFIPEANMWEDVPVSIQALYYSRTTAYYNKHLYHYFQRSISTSNNNSRQSIIDKFLGAKNNSELVESFLSSVGKTKQFSKEISVLKYRSLLYAYPLLSCSKESSDIFRKSYPGLSLNLLFDKSLSIKSKVGFFLRRIGLYK